MMIRSLDLIYISFYSYKKQNEDFESPERYASRLLLYIYTLNMFSFLLGFLYYLETINFLEVNKLFLGVIIVGGFIGLVLYFILEKRYDSTGFIEDLFILFKDHNLRMYHTIFYIYSWLSIFQLVLVAYFTKGIL